MCGWCFPTTPTRCAFGALGWLNEEALDIEDLRLAAGGRWDGPGRVNRMYDSTEAI